MRTDGKPKRLFYKEVGEIKKLAHHFAAQSGDPAFLQKVEKALAGEAATVAKRQAARPRVEEVDPLGQAL